MRRSQGFRAPLLSLFAVLVISGMPEMRVLAQGQAESPIEACRILDSATLGKGESVLQTLGAFFVGLFQTKGGAVAQLEKIDTLHYTNKSVFSSQPRCIKSKAASPRPHLWLPTGVVVRKLGEVEMQGKFWLVETEYGLRTFIRESDLSTMARDLVYFFADGAADVRPDMKKLYCLGQARACAATEYSADRYLSPRSRFAAAKTKDFEPLISGSQNFALQRIDPKLTWKCGMIDVGIYGPNVARIEYGRLNTCDEGQRPARTPPNLDKRIKVVRFSDYVAYFDKKIDAAVLRMESGVLAKLAPEYGIQKQCDETFEFKSDSELAVKAGANLKLLAAIELGGSATKKYLWSMKQSLGDKIAVHIHAFNLETEVAEAKASAAPIQVRYSCDAGTSAPQKAQEIRVSHPLQGQSGDFIFKIKNPGEKPDPNSTSGEFGIDLSDKSQLYNQGYVFEIEGQKDYFSLRDRAFEKLRAQSAGQIQDFYEKADDKLYRARMTWFLAHLVLAAVAKPSPETEDEDNDGL